MMSRRIITWDDFKENMPRACLSAIATHKNYLSTGRYEQGTVQDIGRSIEVAIAAIHGGALWKHFSPKIRRALNFGAKAGDKGVDIIKNDEGGAVLCQCKWQTEKILSTPIQKLFSYGNTNISRRYHSIPISGYYLYHREETSTSGDIPCREMVNLIPLKPKFYLDEVPTCSIEESTEIPVSSVDQWGLTDPYDDPRVKVAFDEHQKKAVDVALNGYIDGKTLIKIKSAPGTGKTKIILLTVLSILNSDPEAVFVISSPRLLINEQLLKCFTTDKCRPTLVDGDHSFEPGYNIYIACDGSLGKIHNIPITAYFRDEAHINCNIKALFTPKITYELSASLTGECDYNLSYRDAVSKHMINDLNFVFTIFEGDQLDAGVVNYLSRSHYSSIVVNFRLQESAISFSRMYNKITESEQSRAYTIDNCIDTDLTDFENGSVRLLCVVGKIEMGYDNHRIDCIVIMEEWKSQNKNYQIMGRGNRLHPVKPGFFDIIIPVLESESYTERLDTLVKLLTDDIEELTEDYDLDYIKDHVWIESDNSEEESSPIDTRHIEDRIFNSFGKELFRREKITINEQLYQEYLSKKVTLLELGINQYYYLEKIKSGTLKDFPIEPESYFGMIWKPYKLSLDDYFSIVFVELDQFKKVMISLLEEYKLKEKTIGRVRYNDEKYKTAYAKLRLRIDMSKQETFPLEPDKHFGMEWKDLFKGSA
jgi:hypothetical protein